MSDLVRVSLSLENDLLEKLETLMHSSGYQNRSEFVRDMIREQLVEQAWKGDKEVVGTVNLISSHESSLHRKKFVELLHHYKKLVLSTTHLHLDPEPQYCIDIVLFKGKASEARDLNNRLRQMKGILHSSFSMNTTGRDLS